VSRRRIVLLAVGATAVTAVLLQGCGGASEKVSALKGDPMATYVPAGAHVVESRGDNEHSTFGARVDASYRRLLELPRGDPERQLRQAVAAAAAAGWKIADGEPFRLQGSLSQGGRKRLATGDVAELDITVFPNGTPNGDVSGPAMLVRLGNVSS
jgi:hypothetical protein